jgi:hypothetical protein
MVCERLDTATEGKVETGGRKLKRSNRRPPEGIDRAIWRYDLFDVILSATKALFSEFGRGGDAFDSEKGL